MDIRAHVITLNEKRLRVWEAQKALLDDTAGRARSAEEQASIERMDAEIVALDAEVREFVTRETREQEAAKLREAQASVFGEPTTIDRRGVDDMILFLRSGGREGGGITWDGKRGIEVDISGARRERELLRMGANAAEIRALAWDTGSVASTVPTTLARTLYQYMEASNCALRMPTRKIPTAGGEAMVFSKLAAHAIATQVIAQGTALAGTDPTFAKMTLDAFKYGELVKVANEVLTDSGIDIGAFLGEDIGRALGRKIDTPLIAGTGSAEPMGIMTAAVGAGTIATGGSLITPTVEKMIDLKYSVIDEYRSDPSACWLMNDSTAGTLSKLRDGAGGTVGAFLWRPSLTNGVIQGAPDTFLDKPVYVDSNVAAQASNAKTVGFGMAAAHYVRTVGNPIIESSSDAGFSTDEVYFRGKWRVDSDTIDPTTGGAVGAWNVIKQSV